MIEQCQNLSIANKNYYPHHTFYSQKFEFECSHRSRSSLMNSLKLILTKNPNLSSNHYEFNNYFNIRTAQITDTTAITNLPINSLANCFKLKENKEAKFDVKNLNKSLYLTRIKLGKLPNKRSREKYTRSFSNYNTRKMKFGESCIKTKNRGFISYNKMSNHKTKWINKAYCIQKRSHSGIELNDIDPKDLSIKRPQNPLIIRITVQRKPKL